MAKAAYCAACGTNVYLADDGRCPQGHDPGQLSNFYEVPDLSPADHAVFDAATVTDKKRSNKVLIIVLVVVGALLLCGVASCAAGIAFFMPWSEEVSQVGQDAVDTTEPGTLDGGTGTGESVSELLPEIDLETELPALTTHFYPGFTPVSFYLVGDGTEIPLEFQVIAASDEVPGFQIAFTTYRYADTTLGSDDDPAWFFGTDSGAVWERAFGETDGADGLTVYELVGTGTIFDAAQSTQIMTDFSAAHGGWIVTDMGMASDLAFTLSGITEADLDDWDGQYTTFDTTWEPDAATGAWVETGFTDQ